MEMRNKDFAVFILTHGRPDNVITIETLKKCGYTGKLFLVIDNEDKTAEQYYKNFGRDKVIMFDKKKYADECDECNNFDERRTITMARNACFDIAKQVGVTYFMELDDDYTSIRLMRTESEKLHNEIKNIDNIIEHIINYYKSIKCKSIAFSQGGDWIGGRLSTTIISGHYPFIKRKCMNSFICSTERPFKFVGAMNEDVNTYTTLGSRGDIFMTIPLIMLTQKQTQVQQGGISDMYKKYGTYCKSFTTVMNMPSSVIATYQENMGRIHHKINWNNTVPKIISEDLKKK